MFIRNCMDKKAVKNMQREAEANVNKNSPVPCRKKEKKSTERKKK